METKFTEGQFMERLDMISDLLEEHYKLFPDFKIQLLCRNGEVEFCVCDAINDAYKYYARIV